MKIRIVALIAVIAFLSSCSGSRYGRIPKAKKQKRTVAKKQFRKKKVTSINSVLPKNPANSIAQPHNLAISKTSVKLNVKHRTTHKTISSSKENLLEENATKRILRPNKTHKIEQQTQTQEVQKGSWLWYVIVGLILMLIGVIIPVLGWVFYVVGVIAVIFGLLLLLGII